jgi:hypothetical protein
VTPTDIQGAKREKKRIGSIGAADGILRVRKLRHFPLEPFNRGPKDEGLGINDPHEGGNDLISDRGVLCAQIQQWNIHVWWFVESNDVRVPTGAMGSRPAAGRQRSGRQLHPPG